MVGGVLGDGDGRGRIDRGGIPLGSTEPRLCQEGPLGGVSLRAGASAAAVLPPPGSASATARRGAEAAAPPAPPSTPRSVFPPPPRAPNRRLSRSLARSREGSGL